MRQEVWIFAALVLANVQLQPTSSSAQNGAVFIAGPTSITSVYDREENLVCVAFLVDGIVMVTWSTSAPAADINRVVEAVNPVGEFPENVDVVTLTITVDSGHCGTYTCTERTLNCTLSASVDVDVAPLIAKHPDNTSIGASMLSSDNASFTCIIQGGLNQSVNVIWSTPAAVSVFSRSQVDRLQSDGSVRSTLTVSSVTYGHIGDYWCTTTYNTSNCRATSQSNSSALFIVEAPLLIEGLTPPQQNVTAGDTVTYSCSFNASEDRSRLSFQPELANFSVYWAGPDGIISDGYPFELIVTLDDESVNTTLTILDVDPSNGGYYSCFAENIDGFDNSTALLYADPVIQPPLYNATINETLTIVCDVQDSPTPWFSWQKLIGDTFQTLDPEVITDDRILNTTYKNLTFNSVIFGDEGIYRCIVETSEFGSIASNDIQITVSPESGVTVLPLDKIFQHEDNVTLTCNGLGGPGNQYNWTRRANGEITQGPLTPTFDLTPVMGGVYSCEVGNTAGVGSGTTTVFVSLRFILQPNNTLSEVGARAVLSCVAESFPTPKYQWFHVDGDIRNNLTGLNDSNLVLDPVQFGDEGDYFCVATSRTNFTGQSRSATLAVSPKGSVTVEPQVQIVNLSDNITFSCFSQGGPNNTYQWYKNSILLPQQTHFNLTIFNIRAADGGEYTCSVMNTAGSENVSATLYVRPYIVLSPEAEIRTIVNSSVNFTCIAEGFPQPEITWFKLNMSERIMPVGIGNVLEFNPVEFGDEGFYECFVQLVIAEEILNSTQARGLLTVSPEGSVKVSPVDQVYYLDDNVTFSCSFLGGLNNSIQWSKDGVDIFGESEREFIVWRIDSNDGGEYICTVSNSAGNESAATTLFVAPYFIDHPIQILSSNGSIAMFSCLAQAFPIPTYVWKRAEDQMIRTEADGVNSSSLLYAPTLFGDEGVYYCEATILNVTVQSDNATLTLAPDGVKISAQPSDTIHFEGNITLNCSNFGGPGNSYSWFKDGQPFNSTDTVLSLFNVTASEGGTYTCVVSNLAGTSSGDIVLYIHPYITQSPQLLVIVENSSTANFTCDAEGFPSPNITWIKYESFENRSIFSIVSHGRTLAFQPVLFGDEGYYACVAGSVRPDGRQLDDVTTDPPSTLAVAPTLTVGIAQHNGTYFLGENTILTCTSLGGPNNSYTWLHNGNTISTGRSLVLTNISAQIGGEHSCVVSNEAGSDSNVTNIYIHPYILSAPVLATYNRRGDSVSFECVVDGFPFPNVTWQSLGLELEYSSSGMSLLEMEMGSNLSSFDNMPLQFSPIAFGDEGYYQCVVSARTPEGVALETISSQPTLVTVSPEGSVRVSPAFQALERFGRITFECLSLGGPNNTYQWRKDNRNLFNQVAPQLTVTNVSAIDGGTYSCLVSNAAGNETSNSTLFIKPYITMNPTPDVLSFAGDNVSFSCEADSFPTPSYFWEKADDNNTVISHGPVLTFAPVEFGADGVYQCIAYITVNMTDLTASSESGLLTVSPAGGVSSSPVIHNSTRNQTITFHCISYGGPDNTFTWVRLLDQTVVGTSSQLEVFVSGEFVGGGYQCDVSNRAGNATFEATLNVAPAISDHPNDLNVTIMEEFILSCEANGFPIPNIVWQLNGTDIEFLNATPFSGSGSSSGSGSNSGLDSGSLISIQVTEEYRVRSVSSTLTISMAMTNDSGNYTCLIISPLSEFSPILTQPARVLVQDVPDPPNSLSAVNITTTSMIVLWAAPHDSNAPILGYRISYQRPSFLGGEMETLNSSATMTFIGGLHPGVVYLFTIVAYNEIGISRPSNVTALPTLDGVPVSSPGNVTVSILSSTSAFFTWTELPEINRSGIITAYEVQYTPLFNCSSIIPGSDFARGNSTELQVDILEENILYSFSVRAHTSAGPGPYGEPVSNSTLKDVPSGPPERVIVSSLSPNSLSVHWDPVNCSQQNGEILFYKVRYETFNNFSGELADPVRYLNTTNRSVILFNLEEYNLYHVIVRAYTSIGGGPYSAPQANRTLENSPSAPPTDIRVFVVSSTQLLIEWGEVPSIDQNGVITQYQVLYEPLNTYRGLINNDSVLVNGLSTVLIELEEDTAYNVSVRAYTSVGPGPYSEPVSNSTLMDVPGSPPINIEVIANSANQLLVTWDPVPEIHQNGPIVHYEVLLSPNDTFGGLLPNNYTTITNFTKILLGDLEEYVVYDTSVRAYTLIGPSNYSEPIPQRTLTAAPSDSVRNVMASTISSTAIRVQWNEVESIHQNGIQTMYEIRFIPDTMIDGIESGSRNTVFPGWYNLTGLEEFVVYNISVRSFTVAGPGPYSINTVNRTFEDVPASSPTNIQLQNISSTSIFIQWNEVLDINQNGIITHYRVMYQPLETFGGRLIPSHFDVPASPISMNASVIGLQEFVTYNFSISAATNEGFGPFSIAVSTTTDSALPASPPLNVNVITESSTALRVTWESPDLIDLNGPLTYYVVTLTQNQFTEIPGRNESVPAGVNVILVEGLQEYVNYTVCVSAVNVVGIGPCSAGVLGATLEDSPAAPVQNLTTNTSGPTHLSVVWDPPPPIHINGKLTQFLIEYRRVFDNPANSTITSVSGTVLSFVLGGLDNYTCYYVIVTAYTAVGQGPPQIEQLCTEENVPGAPPTVTNIRSNSFESILIEWEPPSEKIFGIIRSYTIRYMNNELQNAPFGFRRNISNTSRQFVFDGLLQFTNYSVEIAAVTVGEGVFSDPLFTRTDQDVPCGVPENLAVSALPDPKSLSISWDEVPRQLRKGIIIMYNISYEPLETYGEAIGPGSLGTGLRTSATDNRMLTINGLEENTEYNVSIQAFTIVGGGPFSETITGRTSEGIPSAPPSNVQVNETTKGCYNFTILWESVPHIHQNGNITHYTLRYRPVLSSTVLVNVPAVEGMSYLAVGLIPGTLYSIEVAASTSQGMSDFSHPFFVETIEKEPGPVSSLRSLERFTSISIEWSIPAEPNGRITHYQVKYNTSLTEFRMVDITEDETIFTLEGLSTAQTITFQVRAFTRPGPGPFNVTHATTKDQPPQVQNVMVTVTDQTAIVTWTHLTGDDAENVVEYRIAYRTFAQQATIKTEDASKNSSVILDLATNTEYLFTVSAVAKIDNDSIEGVPSEIDHSAFILVPATLAPHQQPAFQFGLSIPATIILTVVITLVLFLLYLKLKKYFKSTKRPKPILAFEDGGGHYESVEMIRRQLPSIPFHLPTLSGRSTPQNVQINSSYRAVTNSDQVDDQVYDNDTPGDRSSNRYSTVIQANTLTATRTTGTTAPKHSESTPTAIQETYDTVIEDQTAEHQPMQEVYDYDPFERHELNIRRDSNPNLYSKVNTLKNQEMTSKIDTSLVVSNPAVKIPPQKPSSPKPFSDDMPIKQQGNAAAESDEEYEDMSQQSTLLSQLSSITLSDMAPDVKQVKPENKINLKAENTELSLEATKATTATTDKPPPDGEETQETAANERKTSDLGSTDTRPYFQLNPEYDIIISEAKREREREEGSYVDLSGEQASKGTDPTQ